MFGSDFHKEVGIIMNLWDDPCPKANWMLMPQMGFLIASAYRCMLVYIQITMPYILASLGGGIDSQNSTKSN